MYEYIAPKELLSEPVPKSYVRAWRAAQAASFASAVQD
jgi:hypothetical protein